MCLRCLQSLVLQTSDIVTKFLAEVTKSNDKT